MLGTKTFSAPVINHYHQLITGLADVLSTQQSTVFTHLFKATKTMMLKMYADDVEEKQLSEVVPARTQSWKYLVLHS